MSFGAQRDSSFFRDESARNRLRRYDGEPRSSVKPLGGEGYSQLEELLRSAISYSRFVDKTIDDEVGSLSKKSRDIVYHLRAINDLLTQVEAADKDSGLESMERFASEVKDIESRMKDALAKFRRMDFLKGVHSSQKPRVALQKKKYVDEIYDSLRELHRHASNICGSDDQDGGASTVRFVSEEEVMRSIDDVLGELLNHNRSGSRNHITPQVVWMFVCRRLGRSLHDFPMRDVHHHYINHVIHNLSQ